VLSQERLRLCMLVISIVLVIILIYVAFTLHSNISLLKLNPCEYCEKVSNMKCMVLEFPK
jgi:hypothetical protein